LTIKRSQNRTGSRNTPPRRERAARSTDSMPLKWVLIVPLVVLLGLWAGYHFTHSRNPATEAAPSVAADATDAAESAAAGRTESELTAPAAGDTAASRRSTAHRKGERTFVM